MSMTSPFPFLPLFPNLHEVVQQARPSYNPRGDVPALGKKSSRTGWALAPHPTVHSTQHMGWGGGGGVIGKVSVARSLSHSGASLAVIFSSFLPFFFSFLFSYLLSLPNLREAVQRARPSYNPRGTFPRWADSPAAPSETVLYT
jgi:hypothetical protein